MQKIVECVPNFSEGRDRTVIGEITAAIESVQGVRLMDVDPGESTNRTVVTFIGEPEPVWFRKRSSTMPTGADGNTASRSSGASLLPIGLILTHAFDESLRNCAAICRAAGRASGVTASSRSRINASASQVAALDNFFSLSAGTNRKLRFTLAASASLPIDGTRRPARHAG